MKRFKSFHLPLFALIFIVASNTALAFQPYPPRPATGMPSNYGQPQFVPPGYRQPMGYGYAPYWQPQQWQPQRSAPYSAYPPYQRYQPPYQQPRPAIVAPRPQPQRGPAAKVEIPAPVAIIDKKAQPKLQIQQRKPLAENRQAFLEKLAPIVQRENNRILRLRQQLDDLLRRLDAGEKLPAAESQTLVAAGKNYRVKKNLLDNAEARKELRQKIDTIPASLALAQAVNESAWGTSRFAVEGKNLFGIWTYDESKGIVPKKRSKGKTHLVRIFASLDMSVRYYMHNLNSHPAYKDLREIRAQQRLQGKPIDGMAMAAGLTKYSAKGEEYVRLIRDIIRRYNLAAMENSTAGQV